MSVEDFRSFDLASSALLNRPEVELLTPEQERALLVELAECRTRLLSARIPAPAFQVATCPWGSRKKMA